MSAIPRTLALIALLALVLAACGEDPAVQTDEAAPAAEEEGAADDDQAEPPADPEPEPEPAEGEGMAVTVTVASTDLGEVLVDGDGMTLYMFEPDAQGQPTCNDDCAAAWPPLVSDGDPVAGEGADQGLLGTAERDDGTTQVTYDGWPLYHWSGDDAPGDTNGQGINDVWWVLGGDGMPIRAADAADDGAMDY